MQRVEGAVPIRAQVMEHPVTSLVQEWLVQKSGSSLNTLLRHHRPG